jgi:hypothetical protein
VNHTFFSSGSVTVSARLLRALRIWLAATEVEVFSKALSSLISLARSGSAWPAMMGIGARMMRGEGNLSEGTGARTAGWSWMGGSTKGWKIRLRGNFGTT